MPRPSPPSLLALRSGCTLPNTGSGQGAGGLSQECDTVQYRIPHVQMQSSPGSTAFRVVLAHETHRPAAQQGPPAYTKPSSVEFADYPCSLLFSHHPHQLVPLQPSTCEAHQPACAAALGTPSQELRIALGYVRYGQRLSCWDFPTYVQVNEALQEVAAQSPARLMTTVQSSARQRALECR